MRIQKLTAPASHNHQRGAVLAISLIILLVLTLIGVSSMDGSIMEEKMAANAQIATVTFQEADSAVRKTFNQENLFLEDFLAATVVKARDGSALARTRDHSTADISSNTVMTYPPHNIVIVVPDDGNSKDRDTEFHNIEIVGSANNDNISSISRQGYSVGPVYKAE